MSVSEFSSLQASRQLLTSASEELRHSKTAHKQSQREEAEACLDGAQQYVALTLHTLEQVAAPAKGRYLHLAREAGAEAAAAENLRQRVLRECATLMSATSICEVSTQFADDLEALGVHGTGTSG